MKKSSKKYFGFTLVELIIVITILAILATVAFVSFQNYTSQTRDTKRLSDLSQISKGVEVFQIGVGNVPTPDNPKTLTGGSSTLLVGKINSKVLKSLSNNILDPVSGTEYTYATIGNGKYYQIGADSENLVTSIFKNTFADSKSSIVKGNYLFDPSLPSLIISSGSSLYDPNNCFVVNGGTNLVSNNTNCTSILNTDLSKIDTGLVGYWDMETLCDTSNCGSSTNSGYVKNRASIDLSILSGTTLKNHNGANFITKTQTGNSIFGQKSAYISDFDSALQTSDKIKDIEKSTTIQILIRPNFSTNFNGEYSGLWDRNFIFDYYNISDNGTRLALVNDQGGLYSYRNNGGSNGDKKFNYQKDKITLFTVVLNNTLSGSNNYSSNTLYINGIKKSTDLTPGNKYTYSLTGTYINFGSSFTTPENCGIAAFPNMLPLVQGCTLSGATMDEIKVYNRALSDEEILSQAKIAGF